MPKKKTPPPVKAAAKPKPETTLVTAEAAQTLREDGNPIIDGKPRCGAKKRGKDAVCMSTGLMANGKCRLHGGATPHGVASPNFKNGKFSKYMPRHLVEDYELQRSDPELVSNRENLALVGTLINQRLKQIYEGSVPDAWEAALDLLRQYESELNWEPEYDHRGKLIKKEPDPDRTLLILKEHLRRGFRNANAFDLLEPLLESHRKHVDTEYKRLKDLNTKLDTSEAVAVARALVDAVKRHVRDPKQLAAIQADVSRILS